MATFEESNDVGCPVDMMQDDLRTSFLRPALGRYAAPAERLVCTGSAGNS